MSPSERLKDLRSTAARYRLMSLVLIGLLVLSRRWPWWLLVTHIAVTLLVVVARLVVLWRISEAEDAARR